MDGNGSESGRLEASILKYLLTTSADTKIDYTILFTLLISLRDWIFLKNWVSPCKHTCTHNISIHDYYFIFQSAYRIPLRWCEIDNNVGAGEKCTNNNLIEMCVRWSDASTFGFRILFFFFVFFFPRIQFNAPLHSLRIALSKTCTFLPHRFYYLVYMKIFNAYCFFFLYSLLRNSYYEQFIGTVVANCLKTHRSNVCRTANNIFDE